MLIHNQTTHLKTCNHIYEKESCEKYNTIIFSSHLHFLCRARGMEAPVEVTCGAVGK